MAKKFVEHQGLFALCSLLFSLVGTLAAQPSNGSNQPLHNRRAIALVGATVLDVSSFGTSNNDLKRAVVLVRDGKIDAVGPAGKIAIPKDAQVIDVAGKFILPGLIDGMTGMNSQGQANANLYMGVTTVVGSADGRRGHLFLTAHPSPHVYLMDNAGTTDDFNLLAARPKWASKIKGRNPDVELSWEDTSRLMDEQSRMGVRALWLGWNLTSANTGRIIAKARQLGIVTYGEFISTPYAEPIHDGVSLLLHMSRFDIGMISPEMQGPLAAQPVGPLADKAYRSVLETAPEDERVSKYAREIAGSGVALMPTFSLYYTMLPEHRNLWKEPAAAILDPKGMYKPTDPASGERSFASEEARSNYQNMALHMWDLNRAFHKEHPRYLAATGAAVFGSLPGISMHTEMELLVRVGLTPREAIAAATGNYAEQFGWRELGSVSSGRRADLLVLDADPTEDIHNSTRIRMVMLDGNLLDRDALIRH